ncbi:hypothetical protein GCM10023170_092540 [Phytohabitans houttuyneae]|uniref:Beta-xylanase n=1 Tax=Phytohabitans houttuyneae TaxID=1076126 RepID=A0A6V8JX73_9ACTN|nr:endo-1,4-beta-xylanase [Phytohabitans houttuyneae]GFJ77302.1 hypothetical protein Phou_014820 [Phytohabitans houttuyneae]
MVGNTNISDGSWVNLQGQYTLATDVEWLTVYVETASGTASLHIDDFQLSYVPATPIQTDIPSVKPVLAGHFPIGAAISLPQTLGEHARLLSKHFNSVTPGNALKWDATEPAEGAFRFTDADAMVDFARANGMEVRGHTLVWHNQTPAWVFLDASGQPMTATAANKALLLSRLEAHIRGVVGHYGTDIATWDVVNEVIDENQADGLRRSRWYEIAGLDYIRTAFRVTREVAPTAKLYINDYNTNVAAKRDKLYNLASQLEAEGVPIDGVGHQMHVNVDWPSASETEATPTATTTSPSVVPTTSDPTSAPPPTTTPPPSSCRVTYRIVGSWPGGFQGEVQIAPNLAISAWSVSWSFANAQRINQLWSGSHSQNGAACSG